MLTRDKLRGTRVAVLAAAVALSAPAAAHAHGLSVDDDPNRALIQYVILGFEHMALGWDHLLFVDGERGQGVSVVVGTARRGRAAAFVARSLSVRQGERIGAAPRSRSPGLPGA
jgi:hypothetical protein